MQTAPFESRLFPARIRLRTPKGLPAAIELAARRHTSAAEYARQTLLRSIEADGVRLLPDGRVDASALS